MLSILLASLLSQTGSPTTAAQLHALTYSNSDGGRFGTSVMLTGTGSAQLSMTSDAGALNIYVDAGNVVEYTTADVILYVDPLGNDNNACTASGVSACRQPQVAINKIPKILRHRATLNLAAGTYNGFMLSGFTIDPSIQSTTTGILIDGALANSTLATGSATGTVTSATTQSGVTYATVTVSGATWTVDDLKGRLFVALTGTAAGQVLRVTSNTATVITVLGNFFPTVPDATTTFAIQDEAVFINTALPTLIKPQGSSSLIPASAGIQIFNDTLIGSQVTIRNVNVSASTACMSVAATGLELIQISCTGSFTAQRQSAVTLQAVRMLSFASALTGSSVQTNSAFSSGSMFQTVTGSTYSTCSLQSSVFTGSTASYSGISCTTGASCSAGNSIIDCGSASNSAGISVGSQGAPPSSPALAPAMAPTLGSVKVVNCTYGIRAYGNSQIGFSNFSGAALSGNALSYGVYLASGARVDFSPVSSASSLTAGIAEITLDGLINTTFSSLANHYDCFSNLATGSRACKL